LTTADLTKTVSDRRTTIADTRSTTSDRTHAESCNGSAMPDRARAISCKPGMMSDRGRALTDLRRYGLAHRRRTGLETPSPAAKRPSRLLCETVLASRPACPSSDRPTVLRLRPALQRPAV